jgi:hypothetical protein
MALAYLPTIFGIQKIMQNYPPIKNRFINYLLGSWNIILSTGSFIGAYHTLPYLLKDIHTIGLIPSICQGNYINNDNISRVVILFNLSKFLEFIDTLFIVFKKSNLDFLHYYHHITTCIFCWNSGYLNISTYIYFASVNLLIHSIMYFYYALIAFDIQILQPYKKSITFLQTTQMGIGSSVIILWINNCRNQYNTYHLINHIFGLLMYISYGYLFSVLLLSNKKIKTDKKN